MASAGSPGDELSELAARAAAGDRSAVEQLAAQLDPMMRRYCRARIGGRARTYETADDVAQEACIGVYKALPGYNGKTYPFKLLAYRIAANKVTDYYRRQGTDRSTPADDLPEWDGSEPSPEKVALDRELGEHVESLLSVLSTVQRHNLTLRFMAGLSAEETAHVVGTSSGAVRVAQHRALTKLRSVLGASQVPPEHG